MVWVVSRFRLKALLVFHLPVYHHSHHRENVVAPAPWTSQPQKSAKLSPQPGGKPRKFIRTCGGIGVMCCCLLCIFCTMCAMLFFYFRCRTAGYKSVFGRSCDRPPRHRFFLVSLCLQANAEMVPKIPSCHYMLLM